MEKRSSIREYLKNISHLFSNKEKTKPKCIFITGFCGTSNKKSGWHSKFNGLGLCYTRQKGGNYPYICFSVQFFLHSKIQTFREIKKRQKKSSIGRPNNRNCVWQSNMAIPQHGAIQSKRFSLIQCKHMQYIENRLCVCVNRCFGFTHSNAYDSAND